MSDFFTAKLLILFRDCTKTNFNRDDGEFDKTGHIALAPKNNEIVEKLEKFFNDALGYKTKPYDSFDDMKTYIANSGSSYLHLDENGNKNAICFGISFSEGDSSSSRKWTYNFHYNMTGYEQYRDLYGFFPEEERVRPFEIENKKQFKKNIKSGMVYLINYIDTEILRLTTSKTDAYINADMVYAPTPAYKTSTIYNNLNGNMNILIIYPLLVVFLRFIYLILYEKEQKIA